MNENLDCMTLEEQFSKGKSLMEANDDGNDYDTNTNADTNNNNNDNNNDNDQKQQNIHKAIELFENLQDKVHSAALFSSNESLDDISTLSLPLLAIEYHLAKAYLQLQVIHSSNTRSNNHSSRQRMMNVNKAIELFYLFLNHCHSYQDILTDETIEQKYKALVSVHDSHHKHNQLLVDTHDTSTTTTSSRNQYNYKLPPQSRDDKIQQYKLSKSLSSQIQNYKSKLQQRQRLTISPNEEFEGYDNDSLYRTLIVQELQYYALDAVQEIYALMAELQMLQMAVQFEIQRDHEQTYRYGQEQHHNNMTTDNNDDDRSRRRRPPPPPQSNKPLTLTHITQNPITNQLQFKKETIQKSIFQPSWNQPTMTLDELAEKEVQEAIARSQQQDIAEREKKLQPRRYEFLVRDGLEDDKDLVDASAKLDRDWDDWKDENPRGSGNKMGDRGDRNF